MALTLPGERRSRWLETLLAVAAVVILAASGCATTSRSEARARPRARSWAAAFAGTASAAPARVRDPAVALAERALHDAGLRFGTDGSTRALWSYLRLTHDVVSAAEARPGDVVFFDTRATGTPDCDNTTDHVGIVDTVAADGRIAFVEARGGRVQRSFVDPARPSLRRTAGGDIANSFLRAKAVDDPPDARYFAGELLCGVARALPARVPQLPTK